MKSYSYLREKVFHEVDLLIRQMCVAVLLEILIGDFVPILELAIVVAFLLNGVIGQVDESIAQVLQVKLRATGTDVTIFIEITLHIAVNRGQQAIATDIEFSITDQKRPFYVFLDDMRVICLLR